MRLGDVSSLVEVGIGLNLGFGMLEQFRGWLRTRLKRRLDGSADRIVNALVEADEHEAGDGVQPLVRQIARRFAERTGEWERRFVRVALLATLGLFVGLGFIAAASDMPVNPWVVVTLAYVLALGPITLCWGAMGVYYLASGREIMRYEEDCTHAVGVLTSLRSMSVRPASPEAPASGDSLKVSGAHPKRRPEPYDDEDDDVKIG